jgi:Flp pilus assembly protein TadD
VLDATERAPLERLLGDAYARKGNDDGAIEAYTKALADLPTDQSALLGRGLALARKGDKVAARRDLEQLVTLELQNGDPYARTLARQVLRTLPTK